MIHLYSAHTYFTCFKMLPQLDEQLLLKVE